MSIAKIHLTHSMNSSAISLEEHTHTMESDFYSSATTHLTHSMNSSAISLEGHTHAMESDFYSYCSNKIDKISKHILIQWKVIFTHTAVIR